MKTSIYDITENVIDNIDKELARKNNQNLCDTCYYASDGEECDIYEGYWNEELDYQNIGLHHHIVIVECNVYKRKENSNDKDNAEA